MPAITGEARLISALGDTETALRAYKGFYRIRLRGALCNPACDIGGEPVFLVEETSADVPVESVPLISPGDSILATPTPTAAVTATTMPDNPTTAEASSEPTQTQTATPVPSETPTIEPTATVDPTSTATSTTEADGAIADAAQPTLAASLPNQPEPSDAPVSDDPSVASWLFIGAAVILGGILAVILLRQRHS